MHRPVSPGRPSGATLNRCAIYTRKSSEEGLEQDFNSLDAQREACEAYIVSQKSTGWIALPQMYDDGGLSGGTLERPALQRVLLDIGARRVDTVVVYKVDRLTRSLNDFAKIVEVFDTHGVSFVSVTQQFNTTTSMGRLTLNMLLSFAQFEREVTGERIRDKIAASKRKGMWMGGLPPLGYDVADRKLVVNAREADTVRQIYRRYAALKSVRALKAELDEAGIVSKARLNRHGRISGGNSMAVGALYHLLQNPIYRGEIAHKDRSYPGLHEPIIDPALWDETRAVLAANRIERTTRSTATAPSLLAGLVYDDGGVPMSPTHANKKGTRYRYYVSQSLIKRGRPKMSTTGYRVPAADLETVVESRIRAFLTDEANILDTAGAASIPMRKRLIAQATHLAERWPALASPEKRALLLALVARIDVQTESVEISIRPDAVSEAVKPDVDAARLINSAEGPTLQLSVPAQVKRTGMETRLIVAAVTDTARPESHRSLLRLLGQARHFADLAVAGGGKTAKELAREARVTPSYYTRVLRLNFLAPSIVTSILQGRQPIDLSAKRLLLAGEVRPSWAEQIALMGIDKP
jgi:DNA invertase Pin-like site-specific DNA recombinase